MLKKFYPYIRPYRVFAVLAPILMFVEVGCELFLPRLMSDIVDIGLPAGDFPYMLSKALTMLLLSVIACGGGVGCVALSSITGAGASANLRGALFTRVQAFSAREVDVFSPGSLITRLTNDVVQLGNLLTMGLRMLARMPFLAAGAMVMAFSINTPLALTMLASVPVMAAVILLVVRKGYPLFRAMQDKLDKMNTRVQQNLSGIRVVKAFVREDFESERFAASNEELTAVAIKAQKTFALMMPAMALVLNSLIVVILLVSPAEIAKGALEVGLTMSLIQYTMQLLMSLMMSAMVFFFISRAKPSAERVLAVLEEESDIVEKADAYTGGMKGVVEFKNVSFAYPDGAKALKNISFKAEPGKTIAILGSTGSGKSTLVTLIPRLYDALEGSVLIDGIDIRDYAMKALRSQIGVVPQQPVLFSGTVAENIAYGRQSASREEIEEAARAAQAEAFILRREGGYDALLGRKGVNLSGGQKQRLAIARALIMRPRILILDDATSAIDMATEAKIQATLRANYGDCTRIVIAQRVSAVQDADTIIMMEKGEIAAMGSHKELYESCEAYRELVYSQGAMLENTP